MSFRLNKEEMRAVFPTLAPYVEGASAFIWIPFMLVGLAIGAAWAGVRDGFVIGRDA
jgi:hypothetical protein